MSDEKRIAPTDFTAEVMAVLARDSRLVTRTLTGDHEAFEDLVRLYYDRIRSLVYHHLHREDDLDDAMQEIFIRAFEALPGFGKRSSFYTWLYRIASNYCIDRLRKKRLELVSLDSSESPDSIQAKLPHSLNTPERALSQSENVRTVRKALEMLDPIYQNILVLRELEGLSYEEIMESLDLEMGTVKSRLARARAELKKVLIDMDAI